MDFYCYTSVLCAYTRFEPNSFSVYDSEASGLRDI